MKTKRTLGQQLEAARSRQSRAWIEAYETARASHGISKSIEIADAAMEEPVAEAAEALSVRAEDDPSIKLPPHPLADLVPPLDPDSFTRTRKPRKP